MMGRLGASGGGGDDAACGVRPRDLPALVADEHPWAAPSTMPELLPPVVDVVDLLDPVVLLQRHVVEAGHGGQAPEGGLQLAEALDRRRTHVLVAVEDDQTVLVLTGTTDLAK